LATWARSLAPRTPEAPWLSRPAGRASTKAPAYLLPSPLEAAEQGRPHELLALAVAAWFRCLRGSDPTGRPIALLDPRSTELGSLARRGATDPRPLLGLTEVFGDLGQHGNVVDILERQLRSLDEQGWRASLVASLAADGVQSPTCPVRVHQPDPIPGGERPCRLLILT